MTTSTTTAKTSTNKTADIIGSLPAQEVSISSMTTIKQIKQRSSHNNNDTSNNINNSTNKLSKVASEKSMTETDTNTGSYNVGQPIIDLLKHHDKNKNTKTSPSTTTTNKKQVDKDKNVCIVNGEATDGTKNAPVLIFENPSSHSTNNINNSMTNSNSYSSSNQTLHPNHKSPPKHSFISG